MCHVRARSRGKGGNFHDTDRIPDRRRPSPVRVELLKEAVSDLTDIGVLLNPENQSTEPVLQQAAQVAQSLKVNLHAFNRN
jgi:hypothetical protein